MIVTLHSYVLRELLKSLGLSLTALTTLFTLGGGLFNVVRFEGISAGDVIGFLPQLVPIVVTLTLPLATLFSVTMVYGRLAADNELLACRAAGINVHGMFFSGVLLSVFVAAFTLVFGNFVIPGMVRQLELAVRNNLRDLALQKLQRDGYAHYRGQDGGDHYMLTAERAGTTTDERLAASNYPTGPGLTHMVVSYPTFLQVDGDGKLVRFVSAEWGLCMFDTSGPMVEATVYVQAGREFEPGKRASQISQQSFSWRVPLKPHVRFSTARLTDLLHWQRAPWHSPRLRSEIEEFLTDVAREHFFEYCTAQLAQTGVLSLRDDRGQVFRLHGDEVERDRKGLNLSGATAEVHDPQSGRTTRYVPDRIQIRAKPFTRRRLLIEINLIRARREARGLPAAAANDDPDRLPTVSLDGARVPAEVIEAVEQYTAADVIDPTMQLPGGDERLRNKRTSLQNAAREAQRKIAATIHFRLAYTSSVLVTALMGAILGVIFRGARALAAFALATIPFFSVGILMMLGRQLGTDSETASVGPFVTWGGLVLVLVADLLILRVGVRR